MKGLIVLALCFISLGAEAAMNRNAHSIVGLVTYDGFIIDNLSLQESTNLLESLEQGEAFEIDGQVIHSEEVSNLIWDGLTEDPFTAKRPNPQDYN
jgi:hypothetical protein